MDKFKKTLYTTFKYYKIEIISIILLILIIMLLTTSILSLDTYIYFNNYISENNIIAVVLLLFMFFLKDSKKINIFLMQSTIAKNTLIYEVVYYTNIFSLLLLNIYIDNLGFLIGLTIFVTELFLLLSIKYKQSKNEINREFLKLWQYKEIHYVIMMALLLLQNYPFEMYNIPLSTILATLYIVVNLNIVYKIYEQEKLWMINKKH
ncbi:MAG: hypothetical protein ACK5HR_06790 [Mycoplasmatales bacterium]